MYSLAKKPTTGIPIPANVAAVWGGFIYEGLLTAGNPEHMQRVLHAWNQGCAELVTAACAFLPELWQQITVAWNEKDTDFPAVFEYEVVAELGKYLGDYLLAHNGNLPEMGMVNKQICQLIHEFFEQSPVQYQHIKLSIPSAMEHP